MKNWIELVKKTNLWPPGWRFFLSSAFPDTRVFLSLTLPPKSCRGSWEIFLYYGTKISSYIFLPSSLHSLILYLLCIQKIYRYKSPASLLILAKFSIEQTESDLCTFLLVVAWSFFMRVWLGKRSGLFATGRWSDVVVVKRHPL